MVSPGRYDILRISLKHFRFVYYFHISFWISSSPLNDIVERACMCREMRGATSHTPFEVVQSACLASGLSFLAASWVTLSEFCQESGLSRNIILKISSGFRYHRRRHILRGCHGRLFFVPYEIASAYRRQEGACMRFTCPFLSVACFPFRLKRMFKLSVSCR